MNTVTSKTAKALRDAGFPQPESVAKGQYWYSANGGTDMLFSVVSFPEETTKSVKKKGWIFAPQAHDILAQLPDGYRLTRANKSMFICTESEAVIGDSGCKDNPHEAAAKAFLELAKRPSAG